VADDEHDEDEKLHNSEEELHNSGSSSGKRNIAAGKKEKDTYTWYGPTGKAHSAPRCEDGGVRLEDLKLDEEEVYAYRLNEIAKHTEELRSTTPKPTQTQRGTEGASAISAGALAQKESSLTLSFSRDELDRYVLSRKSGLAEKSRDWINRSSKLLWDCTIGEISHQTVETLRERTLKEYTSTDSHSKVLSFAKSFLKFLATTRAEPRYITFVPYLELPKTVKERKSVTSRIVTKEDINNVLQHISKAERLGKISPERSAQYSALVLFGAYTGQRSEATTAKLTVGQFREAMAADKPVLQVDSSQDKIRMSHYVPLHPRIVEALKPLLAGRNDDELMFTHNSFLQWIKRQKIPMSRFQKPFVLGDLRKVAEQFGDVIEWDQSNRAYILTHGVSGVEWSHYRNPLPENVYDIYMKYWTNVDLTI
jgi:integrase